MNARTEQRLWHESHDVVGKIDRRDLRGPCGGERCLRCGARLWARPEEYGKRCGSSIDYDSRITKPCTAVDADDAGDRS